MDVTNNLSVYEAGRAVPKEAQKTIGAGRLKGMTDINPMWRIKKLTELFGLCGVGWKYEIVKEWFEPSPMTNEIASFMHINLYVRLPSGEWSDPIPGTGGNAFVASETKGLRVNDECLKSSLTDALSVACKALGIGADVYWNSDRTKYSSADTDTASAPTAPAPTAPAPAPTEYKCCDCGMVFEPTTLNNGTVLTAADVYGLAKSANTDGKARCKACSAKAGTRKQKEVTNG